MKEKYCWKCKQNKLLTEFHKNRLKKDGLATECKACAKIEGRKYYEKNKETLYKQHREYALKNREATLKYHKDYYTENKDRLTHQGKLWYINNQDKVKKYKEDNKDRIKDCQKKHYKIYYDKNSEKLKAYQKEYRKNNLDKINKRLREKYKNNIHHKLIVLARTRLTKFLKGKNKSKKTRDIFGCSVEFLKQHLEKQFKEGMNWQNHGEWHIDHILPLSLAKSEEELYKLFHYTNLQPLWGADNLSKGAKLPEPYKSN